MHNREINMVVFRVNRSMFQFLELRSSMMQLQSPGVVNLRTKAVERIYIFCVVVFLVQTCSAYRLS